MTASALDALLDAGRPLRLAELAQALGCSPGFLRKLLDAGRLRGYRVGRCWRVTPAEARRLAEDLGALAHVAHVEFLAHVEHVAHVAK